MIDKEKIDTEDFSFDDLVSDEVGIEEVPSTDETEEDNSNVEELPEAKPKKKTKTSSKGTSKTKAKAKESVEAVDTVYYSHLPFKQRIMLQKKVEKIYPQFFKDILGKIYVFNLNLESFVVFFDGKTKTTLPLEVYEYFEDKLNRIMDMSGKKSDMSVRDDDEPLMRY